MADTPDVDPRRVPAPLGPTREQRDRVVERLQQAFGDGAMTVEQLDERLELAESARDLPELVVLTRDLPAVIGDEPPPPSSLVATKLSVPAMAQPTGSTSVMAVFGGGERKGVWAPPAHVRGLAVFGGVDIDLRHAEIVPGSTTHIHCLATFGGVNITVPPTVNVVTSGMGIFGGFSGKDRNVNPEAPTIKVTGLAVFGGVTIKVREPKA